MALISAAAVAVVVVVSVVLAQRVASRELMHQVDASLVERVEDTSRVFEGRRGPNLAEILYSGAVQSRGFNVEELLGRRGRGFDAVFIQVLLPDGRVAAPPDQPVELPVEAVDLELAAEHGGRALRTVTVGGDRIRVLTTSVPGGAIQVARSLDEVDQTLKGVTGTLTFAGGIGVVLAGLLGLVVARSALRPVDELTETVEHVAQTKELAARIDIDRDDEIGRLAKSFNAMLSALETSRIQQQQLVRDAGHELRTPLTALRTNIELLARTESLDEEQRREVLDAATFELRELTDLTTELVDLAADPSAVAEPRQTERIDELVERVAERFRWRTNREITVKAEPFTADVGVVALERAVSNLIDNAHKWSPRDAAIEVTVGAGRVAVSDSGPGIAEEDRHRVFDRFYRADAARTTAGSGLGLAIVKKVVEEHGGTVFVESSPGGGATVGFAIPVV